MRQQRQEQPNKSGHISDKVIQELEKKTFEELSYELFLMGDGEGQEDLMDVYVQLMQEKCPPDDGSFDFDAAMDEVKKKIAEESDSLSSQKYDFLQLLTMENLELLSKVGESNNEAELLLEAVRKEAMNRGEVEATPNGEQVIRDKNLPKKDPHRGRTFSFRTMGWIAAIVAITAVLTVGGMVGAQASGLNVFGYLAQWTSEKFSFVVNPGQGTEPEYLVEFRETLGQHKIPPELAPTWIPDGFHTDGPMYDEGNPFCDSVRMDFYHSDGREFTIRVDHYFSPENIGKEIFENDSVDVDLYVSNGRAFYILPNVNTVMATWADEALVVSIEGFLSADEVKQIIDSMGG